MRKCTANSSAPIPPPFILLQSLMPLFSIRLFFAYSLFFFLFASINNHPLLSIKNKTNSQNKSLAKGVVKYRKNPPNTVKKGAKRQHSFTVNTLDNISSLKRKEKLSFYMNMVGQSVHPFYIFKYFFEFETLKFLPTVSRV